MTDILDIEDEVTFSEEYEEPLSASTAREIAAAYQSPGAVGSDLAAFASTGALNPGVLDDIEQTRSWFRRVGENPYRADLDALESWAKDNRPVPNCAITSDGYTIDEGGTCYALLDGPQRVTVEYVNEAQYAEYGNARDYPSWFEVVITIENLYDEGGSWTGGIDARELYNDRANLP
ncbi:hypothetical protein [Glycomyces buryatensis]|uniref:Uncharacterized protein n=1 Tax=Glycomyces buryatensis TaxID=2570927 RepID=A0A4S8Q5U5_9ACTN|nr:hypothetical protein [Glycomyces buryatensis]THV39633.1 hypothetical protein FAB82_17335 [Glycomyces buryatensis]